KNGIDWTRFYHNDENSLFDFNFKNFYLDVKNSTVSAKCVTVSFSQLGIPEPKPNKEIKILVTEIERVEGKKNIVELLSLVTKQHDLLNQKIDFWKTVDTRFINMYTADENNRIFFLKKDKVPVINFVSKGNYSSGKVKISTIDAEELLVKDIFE
ncbi:MAG: hypothetical protein LBV22_03690, partial [Mycoplasmataceae bacterium]|nr:hypothetical protein [Mycoplasmataceae bacterium]